MHRKLTIRGRFTVKLVSRLTGQDLTKQENMILLERTETTVSKPVKLDTSCSKTYPLWRGFSGECLHGRPA